MLDWLAAIPGNPRQVFVNHGQDSVCDTFAAIITEKLGVEATAPYNGAIYDLETGLCLQEGNRTRLAPRKEGSQRSSGVFNRLLEAGRRLLRVIEQNRGGTNKDLARFADQIDALSNKWERK